MPVAHKIKHLRLDWTTRFFIARSYSSQSRIAAKSTRENVVSAPNNTLPKSLTQALFQYKTRFTKDKDTVSAITKYENFNLGPLNKVKIGVLYDQKSQSCQSEGSKIIDILLADPLSENYKQIFNTLVKRSSYSNNVFEYNENFQTKASSNYDVPSPFLSAQFRQSFSNSFEQDTKILHGEMNNIKLFEINDLSKDIPDCHIYLLVTGNITGTTISNKLRSVNLQDKIVLTVVDNSTYSPSSNYDTKVNFDSIDKTIISINSNIYFKGIQAYLELDAKAGLHFTNSLVDSNIYELQKALVYYSSTPVLKTELLHKIRNNIKESQEVNKNTINTICGNIESTDVVKFGELAHSELQNELIPNTEFYFKKKLKWWKMYWKNDNVEYDLKDYFSNSFMPRGIENYNYIRGKIVSRLQSDKNWNYTKDSNVANPLLLMKESLITHQIATEIQPVVYSAITSALLYYQLPLTVIGFLSYQYFAFTMNSAIAIGLLGWVVGFNHASKKWEIFTQNWTQQLFEKIRICITNDCVNKGLNQELNFRCQEEIEMMQEKASILEVIEKNLE